MSSFSSFEKILREKAVRPIRSVGDPPLTVEFEDGERVTVRNDLKLHLFFVYLQHVTLERLHGDVSHCAPESLHFYRLLGFSAGDAVRATRDGVPFSVIFVEEPR